MNNQNWRFLLLGFIFLSFSYSALARGQVRIQRNRDTTLYIGTITTVADSDVFSLNGTLGNRPILTLESPKKFQNRKLEIMLRNRKTYTLQKLMSPNNRIAFRLRPRALKSKTDFIYDTEIFDAFNLNAIPPIFKSAGALDKYLDIPTAHKPKYPKNLPESKRNGVSKFVILINEQGTLLKALSLKAANKDLDRLTKNYIEQTKFKIGKSNGEPTPYFLLIAVFYFDD